MMSLSHSPPLQGSPRDRRILVKDWAHHKKARQRLKTVIGVSLNQQRCLPNGAHLTRRISQGHVKRSLGIILLLEIEKRFFDCI
jgi:hypothetical protein